MPLELFLREVAPRHRAAALYEQLRDSIDTGRMTAGERLPTSRELAVDVGVARSTVTTVYGRLVAEGYAVGRVGDGTFVAAGHVTTTEVTGTRPAERPAEAWRIDLRTGRPDPRLFPVVPWRRSTLTALQTAPPGYGHPAGLPELRRALAAWVGRSRGVRTTAAQIVVTAGAQGAFDLLARTFLERADIAVEEPGYPPARRALRSPGARLVPVGVDDDGLIVEQVPPGGRAVYTTPSHQAPSGAILSIARRRQLLDLARRDDLIVIEDDYDTELRYVDRPLEPLQRLDPDRVAYVGSFSKTVTPSLRIGFVVAPPALVDELVAARAEVDTQPPYLTQAALAAFITSGELERHLRRTRRVYRQRRNHVVDRLDELVDDGVIAGHDPCLAGLHVAVRFTDGTDVGSVVAALRDRGVAVNDTTAAWLGPVGPLLELGFGMVDEAAIDDGLAELADVRGRAGLQRTTRPRRRRAR